MRILFLACLRANTGNSTTAQRIRSHLEAAGHECELRDASAVQSPVEVANLISERKFDAGLAIHVFKAGRFLLDNGIPFGVIFGGTDINEDVKNEEKFWVMGTVLEEARFAVAFTCKMKDAAAKYWPQAISKIHIQPQGILTTPNVSFDIDTFLQNSEWHERDPSICLVIIGPTVDPVFTSEVRSKLHNIDGVYLVEEIPLADVQALIKRSFAVVNSSLSEGMSAAILEAMDLEVPVLARDIPGNAAIMNHEDTGLIFSNPTEFVKLAKRLMSEPDLKRKITNNAKNYIRSHHSWELERETYQNLVQICLTDGL
ncbi:hypothetical protein GDO81_002290 [Engystomops pustulosus]|uniref:Glycosyl transferase family 1 domain-containing protein n=1 Tax=Engystomops pustulosus TaxID=76066 RepID=A0AAV7DMM6_ENGPU|nr:hypothetical protein GDO81_002290 [Engystomops pustulosus]